MDGEEDSRDPFIGDFIFHIRSPHSSYFRSVFRLFNLNLVLLVLLLGVVLEVVGVVLLVVGLNLSLVLGMSLKLQHSLQIHFFALQPAEAERAAGGRRGGAAAAVTAVAKVVGGVVELGL